MILIELLLYQKGKKEKASAAGISALGASLPWSMFLGFGPGVGVTLSFEVGLKKLSPRNLEMFYLQR
jgi:hypothetical protein